MSKLNVDKDLFKQHAENRKLEQELIKKSIVSGEKKNIGRGRPVKTDSEKMTTVSIRMTTDRRQKLKEYAVRNARTISDVLAEFVDNLDLE